MYLNDDAKMLIDILENSGYKAYAVGGCVRDALMGINAKDFDITTSAKPNQIEDVLSSHNIKFVETGIKHGTVSAILNHIPYEITTFRTDGDYTDNRHPQSVQFVNDIKDDLSRRDFTINAMAYNGKEIVDYFDGKTDLKRNIIKCVGNPNIRFQEDALRIMRALRFASVLDFEIESKTSDAILSNKDLLKNIAPERIYVELIKLLMGDACERILCDYRDVIAVIIPELKPTFDYQQNSKWHTYDVYIHTIKTVALSPKKDYIRLALLLHDIGKPYKKTTDDSGQDHFKGHPQVSYEFSKEILKRLKVSNNIYDKVTTLVKLHDLHITTKPSNIKKWLRLLGPEFIFDFVDLKIADLSTHNLTLVQEEIDTLYEIRDMINVIIESGEPYLISDLVVNGNDLKKLGYSGKEISDELERLLKIVWGDKNCNTKKCLLNQAEQDKK